MKTHEIKKKFIEFFQSKQHTLVPSASTIPTGDPTLLFTIAGMTPFKGCLSGEETRPYKRATSVQKCVRIGDLDAVGHDGRHCTFFEMLGSWSFGDYFKQEAIEWAYQFVCTELKLDLSRLWVTVHHSDHEAFEIWKNLGIPDHRIQKLGDQDNFWAMGPTGPCGPSSELYLDQGPLVGECSAKGLTCRGPGCDCDRYLEFWNLVFMQYDRTENGALQELPFKSIDTGLGVERVAALMQGKHSAFEIDLFQNIKNHILKIAQLGNWENLSLSQKESCNIIADHMRLLTFTLADGAHFSHEGRGYVLRRVLRRAARRVHQLVPTWPQNSSFLQKIVPAVVEEMGLDYVELKARQGAVEKAIADEELRFHATLKNGFSKFQAFVEEEKAKGNLFLSGEKIFILHDSFGFPADLTKMLCEEIGFQACVEDFEKEMQQQKDRSRAEGKFYKFEHAPAGANWVTFREENLEEDRNFAGGSFFEATGTNENQVEIVEVPLPVDHIKKVRQLKNKLFELVIANTPFYPEGGGQVSDTGWIELWHGERCHQFEVIDVQRTPNAIVHVLRDTSAVVLTLEQWKHFLENSSKIVAVLHFSNRLAMMRHHTATHLMHRALQIVLGDHVRQAGSLVNAKALRFDFTHQKALSAQELKEIECFVNAEILKNSPLKIHENISLKSAKDLGAIALFDEKYEDKVRMVEVLGFSKELCGGTHVPRTGHLGLFKIIFEGSVTSGIRRLEAVTGKAVLAHVQKLDNLLETSSHLFKCAPHEIPQKISALQKHTKDLENQLIKAQSKWVNEQVVRMCAESQRLPHHIQLVLSSLENTSLQEAELLCDRLKEKNNIIAVIFLRFSQGLAQLLVAISPELIKQFKNLSAHLIVKELSCVVGAKGGGKAEFAKAGGVQPAQIPMAFEAVSKIITQMIF